MANQQYGELFKLNQNTFYQKSSSICQPLEDLFAIDAFTFSNLSKSGDFYHLANRPDMYEDYLYSNQICTSPSVSRLHYTMIPDIKIWTPQHENNQEFNPLCQYFERNKVISAITLTVHKESNREIYHFATHKKIGQDKNYWFNIIRHLYDFIEYFSEEAKPIIHKAQEKSIKLSKIVGNSFFEDEEEKNSSSSHSKLIGINFRKVLLKQSLENKKLTPREISILEECLKGKKAKQIANELSLSHRTIENNIQRIKDKFNCHSLREMSALFIKNN